MDVNKVGPLANLTDNTFAGMELLYEQTFNFDKPEFESKVISWWAGHLHPEESTYGYYFKEFSTKDKNDKTYRAYNPHDVYWGEYGICNQRTSWANTSKWVYNHNDLAAETDENNAKSGYMLYCDGSEIPGEVFSLKVNTDVRFFKRWFCTEYGLYSYRYRRCRARASTDYFYHR